MNNKIDIKMIPRHAEYFQRGIDWLKKQGYAQEFEDQVKEVIPQTYKLRLFRINCRGAIVTVRRWQDTEIENPEIKSVVFRAPIVGLILIAGSNIVSNYLQQMGLVYKDGDSIGDIIEKVAKELDKGEGNGTKK